MVLPHFRLFSTAKLDWDFNFPSFQARLIDGKNPSIFTRKVAISLYRYVHTHKVCASTYFLIVENCLS